jgi:Uncharacterised protein family
MLYFFRILFLLIKIDQKTFLNWFGIDDPSEQDVHGKMEFGLDLTPQNFEPSPDVSLTTFHLILVGLWEKIQDGLTLADIENILLFILFIRFVILAFRYNLKTSFYITSIGLFAGYLWYRHLLDLVTMYRVVLLKLPFFHKLGIDAIELLSMHRQLALTDLKLGENAHWYNPGQVLYYGFTKGITDIDPETGFRYYIDPISMIVSNLKEPTKSSIFPLYYKVYHKFIPKIYDVCCKFWNQLSGVAAYAVITRIGKRYCPYLVRWHWTFLLIIGLVEQIFVYFIYRVYHFQTYVLLPKLNPYGDSIQHIDVNVAFEVELLNAVTVCIVLTHIAFILFGLFHAICGQYFYVPFFVENTELHIGPRPISSIYSGGQTAWQDPKEKVKNLNRIVPRLWYGWFGRGTDDPKQFINRFQNFIKKIFQRLKKSFKR